VARHLFEALIIIHIIGGVLGAVTLWIPLIGQKGSEWHRRAGRIFTKALLVTGVCAVLMSVLTLSAPFEMHPQLVGRFDESFIRGIFGWMMLFLGVLTLNLAWYGWLCAKFPKDRRKLREWRNLALQPLLVIAGVNCAVQGWLIEQGLMIAISFVGFATVATNLWYMFKPRVSAVDWQKEHLKALVGAGISVYTAFMAFGSVRIFPELALDPKMWAIPLTIGVSIILYHWVRLDSRVRRAHRAAPATKS
jgi:NADH:ubiquinone oxidoreductase subunit 6 (subunit J)